MMFGDFTASNHGAGSGFCTAHFLACRCSACRSAAKRAFAHAALRRFHFSQRAGLGGELGVHGVDRLAVSTPFVTVDIR